MISVMDHAVRANVSPIDSREATVAMSTPHTTTTLEATWKAVRMGSDFTKPVAACITSNTAAFWKIITVHFTVSYRDLLLLDNR